MRVWLLPRAQGNLVSRCSVLQGFVLPVLPVLPSRRRQTSAAAHSRLQVTVTHIKPFFSAHSAIQRPSETKSNDKELAFLAKSSTGGLRQKASRWFSAPLTFHSHFLSSALVRLLFLFLFLFCFSCCFVFPVGVVFVVVVVFVFSLFDVSRIALVLHWYRIGIALVLHGVSNQPDLALRNQSVCGVA